MRRAVAYLSATIVFALALAFAPVKAAPDFEQCNNCQARCGAHYEQCQKNHPLDNKCDDAFNECIVHCFRHFCEQ